MGEELARRPPQDANHRIQHTASFQLNFIDTPETGNTSPGPPVPSPDRRLRPLVAGTREGTWRLPPSSCLLRHLTRALTQSQTCRTSGGQARSSVQQRV